MNGGSSRLTGKDYYVRVYTDSLYHGPVSLAQTRTVCLSLFEGWGQGALGVLSPCVGFIGFVRLCGCRIGLEAGWNQGQRPCEAVTHLSLQDLELRNSAA